MSGHRILVIDDEENIRKVLHSMLTAEGYAVSLASNLAEARKSLRSEPIEVVLTDLKLDREDGLALLRHVRDEGYRVPVVILTAHGTIDSAVDSMKQGAFDYLSKPFDRLELVRTLRKAVLTFQYQSEDSVRTFQTPGVAFPMIGRSEKMIKIFSLIDKVAPSDATVLITGESGTGKELIAQALHDKSRRALHPFIKINCAAIPDSLMESELFGYERGAFTGATTSKPGRFELADKGTLFLDEIGEMSTEMQVKLLRVLQDRCFERVGGLRTIKVDVRLVTATNRDLDEAVKTGIFRSDLFYRLNVVPIHLPPLRERPEDIPSLTHYFLNKFSEQVNKPVPPLNPESLELLTQFPWPGNIRQLENLIERLVVIHEGPITPDQLPEDILDYEEQRFLENHSLKEMVKDATRRIERKAIEEALEETQNNVTQAARRLNISRKGLQIKMKELGLR